MHNQHMLWKFLSLFKAKKKKEVLRCLIADVEKN